MADFNYARSRRTADRLLRKFGASRIVQLYRPYLEGRTGVSPGPASEIRYNCAGVILSMSQDRLSSFDIDMEPGTLIMDQMRLVLLSPVMARVGDVGDDTITPQPQDRLVFDGRSWIVLGNSPLNPAGTVVLHKLGVKLG